MKPFGRHRRQYGFTLLEMLVAFSIMAFSLTMLYRASGGSVRSIGETEGYQRASVLADSLLALRDGVDESGWDEAGQSAGFSWRIQSVPFPTAVNGPAIPPLHEIMLSIAWTEGGRSRELQLFTLRPQRRPPAEATAL